MVGTRVTDMEDGWRRKNRGRYTDCPYQLEGLCAYACWQASVFTDIHEHFLGIWKGLELPREHLNEPIYPINLDSDVMELDGDDI